ncbi:hypothetical protein QBC39DRAFT_353597 [Podospora conica]|nr:hypothetical protein QBC39DRAFT_353597 [Schizothecium conicum]
MSSSPSPKSNSAENTAPQSSRLARGLVTFIGVSRTLAGVGCLLAPSMTATLFGFSTLSPEAALLARMFGAREIVIGEGLLLAERHQSTSHGTPQMHAAHQQLVRAIWANIAKDGLDILAVLVTLGLGMADEVPVGKMAATAGLFVGLGLGAVWMYK